MKSAILPDNKGQKRTFFVAKEIYRHCSSFEKTLLICFLPLKTFNATSPWKVLIYFLRLCQNGYSSGGHANINIFMPTHRHTHTLRTSNSRAHFPLRIQAANAGACGCCLLDISLPKGIYFILPSNPLSSQFSQDHMFFLAPFPFSETFGNVSEDLTTVLSQGNSWFISVPPPPSILCSVERAQFRAGNFTRVFSSLVCFGTVTPPHPLYHECTFADRCLCTAFTQCSGESEGAANLVGMSGKLCRVQMTKERVKCF